MSIRGLSLSWSSVVMGPVEPVRRSGRSCGRVPHKVTG